MKRNLHKPVCRCRSGSHGRDLDMSAIYSAVIQRFIVHIARFASNSVFYPNFTERVDFFCELYYNKNSGVKPYAMKESEYYL